MTSPGCVGANRLDRSASEADQRFLDEAFERILEALEENEDVRAAQVLQGRTHLAEQVDALIDLAKAVAIHPAPHGLSADVEGYIIRSLIGRGGMGAVYLAHQQRAGGRPVALKVLPRALATASARERFELEALTVAKLSHPNIVRVHDVVRSDEVFAFAMEFVDGASLQRVIESVSASSHDPSGAIHELMSPQQPLPHAGNYCRLVAAWGVQIADALQTVHSSGLFHRDVKPSNILIRRDGVALLGDFGLVQEAAGRTITMTLGFVGTAAYAPPEQLRGGFHELDARADVYALGASIFHALALRRPFSGVTSVQVLHQVELGGPPRLRGTDNAPLEVPGDLEAVVRKAMDPEVSRRYESAAAFAEDLQRFLDDRPVHARPASVWYRAAKHVRRNRRTVMVSMLAGMLALGAATVASIRLFLFPQWSERALQHARVLSVVPDGTGESTPGSNQHDSLFSQAFWGETPVPSRRLYLDSADEGARRYSTGAVDRFERARNLYDRAVLFGDPRGDASAERASLDFVLAGTRAPESSPTAHLSREGGVLGEYAAYVESLQPRFGLRDLHVRTDGVPRMDAVVLQRAHSGELRQLGLAAYLSGDSVTATDAWTALEQRGEDDAFTSGMLGILYLINEDPILAYPRLRTAMVAFPETPAFTMFAADAAAQVGDRTKARQYLELARGMRGCDGGAAFRVDCMIRLDEGDLAGVLENVRIARCTKNGMFSQVVAYQLCKKLRMMRHVPETDPQVRDGVLELATLSVSCGKPARRAAALFSEVGPAWWLSLDNAARVSIARHYFHPDRTTAPLEGGCDWKCNFLLALASAFDMGMLPEREWRELVGRYQKVEEAFSPGSDPSAAAHIQAEKRRLTLPTERVDVLARWIVTGEGSPPEEVHAPVQRAP